MNEHYVIYKITHEPTGKEYIGLTSRTPAERFNEHMYNAINRGNGNTKFARFIKEHPETMEYKYSILEEGDMDRHTAGLIESKYIDEYDTMNNGLNACTRAGSEKLTTQERIEIGKRYINGTSLSTMANDYNVTKMTIINVIKDQYDFSKVFSSGLQPPPFFVITPGLPFAITPYRIPNPYITTPW